MAVAPPPPALAYEDRVPEALAGGTPQALRSELEALPTPHRKARLDAMWEQTKLLDALRDEFVAIFGAHGYAGPGTPLPEDAAA